MTPAAIGLALFAAVVHATWNAALRSRADRLWSITVMSFAPAVVAIPFALLLPLPSPASWPYMAASSCLQVGYSVFLAHAYRHGDLTQVYPVVRGSVPLLVTVGGLLLAGQALSASSMLGVILVSLGIASLAFFGRRAAAGKSIPLALITGFFIACYVTLDAVGVRAAGNPAAYTAWICLIYGVLMPATFIAARGKPVLDVLAPETLKALAAGLLTLISYGAIWALSLGPAGPVSALRETSVVFAILIGRFFLGEPLTTGRVSACAGVALGAFILTWQP